MFDYVTSYIYLNNNRNSLKNSWEPKDLFTNIFLTKLLALGKIDGDDYDREYGKFFNYPKCCIDNYIMIQNLGRSPLGYMRQHYNHPFNPYGLNGRVKCPKCLEKEKIKNGNNR